MTTLEDIAKRLERLEALTALASKDVLDVNETAQLTGYTVKYLRLLISRREIPHYRRGNRIFFNRDEVEEWMMGNRIPTIDEVQQKACGYQRPGA
jgi:excisionase family DNA binding protein